MLVACDGEALATRRIELGAVAFVAAAVGGSFFAVDFELPMARALNNKIEFPKRNLKRLWQEQKMQN